MSAASGSYLTELADLLFPPEHRQRLLCMLVAAYLDASGKTEDVKLPGTPVIAIAGYVAPVDAWLRFGKKWRPFLKDFGLTLAHHKDFAARAGEYAGWPEKRRHAYVKRGAHIINQTVHHGVAVAVLLKDYAKVTAEYPAERSAFTFVSLAALNLIGRWARESKKSEQVAYFFEAGDGHNAELLQVQHEILADPRATDVYRFKSMTIVPKKDPDSIELQPADWLAWEAAKYLKDTTLKTEDPRAPRHSLLPLVKPNKLMTLWYSEDKLLKLREARRRGETGRL